MGITDFVFSYISRKSTWEVHFGMFWGSVTLNFGQIACSTVIFCKFCGISLTFLLGSYFKSFPCEPHGDLSRPIICSKQYYLYKMSPYTKCFCSVTFIKFCGISLKQNCGHISKSFPCEPHGDLSRPIICSEQYYLYKNVPIYEMFLFRYVY